MEGLCRLFNFFLLQGKKVLGAVISAVRPPELLPVLQPRLLPSSSRSSRQRQFIANMFKPSQPMMARLRLTTKQVNGGYYKGNRTGSMGYFNHKGKYVIDWKKVRTYVVPEDLNKFKVGLNGHSTR